MDAIERIRKEGYDEGFNESINKAEAKFQERLLKIAKKLIKEGFSLDFIAKTTGIDNERLASLQQPNN